MAPRIRIPPERQSTRLQSHSNNLANNASLDDDFDNEHEIEEDWEEGESEAQDEDVVFKSRTKLPDSSVQRWRLWELIDMLESGWIDLDPDYQRAVVWLSKGMSGLINSLIEDYYIPPIIFNVSEVKLRDGTHRNRRVCVDGKQRLSSVQAFMRGEIPCHDRRGKPWFYCDLLDANGDPIHRYKHARRRVWSTRMQEEFRNKSFVSYEFKDLTRVQEEDLFARVQKGMPLTAAEKLHASSGPWQKLAKRFETEFSTVVNLSANGRAIGFRNLLTSFAQIIETQNPGNADGTPRTKIQMPSVVGLCNNHAMCGAANKVHLQRVFTKFQELVEMSPKTFQNNSYKVARNFAPVEMPAVSVLISEYIDTRNNTLLIGDIEAMREAIRQHLPDLRMDNVTWKSIWQFISELESFRGAADGSSVPKKQFTPKATTARAIARLNTRLQAPLAIDTNDTGGVRAGRQGTSSTQYSRRSTPVTAVTPASAVSSNTSASFSGYLDDSRRNRSSSVDSVLGNEDSSEPGEDPPLAVPPRAPTAQMGSFVISQRTKLKPVVKVEAPESTTLSKRVLPAERSTARNKPISSKRVKLNTF